MHSAVDPHLGAVPDTRPVEDGGPRGQEGVVTDKAAYQVGPRPHHHVVSDPRMVPSGAAHHSVLHHDAVFTYLHRPALGGESTTPNMTREPSPTFTSPQRTAFGAT